MPNLKRNPVNVSEVPNIELETMLASPDEYYLPGEVMGHDLKNRSVKNLQSPKSKSPQTHTVKVEQVEIKHG